MSPSYVWSMGRPLHPEGCLFCRGTDEAFSSEEHVFSRGLGNVDEKVLAPGVACDKCNRRQLSVLDQTLVEFPSIHQMRTFLSLRTRSGRTPVSAWKNATVTSPMPGHLLVEGGMTRRFAITAAGE